MGNKQSSVKHIEKELKKQNIKGKEVYNENIYQRASRTASASKLKYSTEQSTLKQKRKSRSVSSIHPNITTELIYKDLTPSLSPSISGNSCSTSPRILKKSVIMVNTRNHERSHSSSAPRNERSNSPLRTSSPHLVPRIRSNSNTPRMHYISEENINTVVHEPSSTDNENTRIVCN